MSSSSPKTNACKKVADGGSQEDYIERVAREKLGYVMPDEKVYYDITPGN